MDGYDVEIVRADEQRGGLPSPGELENAYELVVKVVGTAGVLAGSVLSVSALIAKMNKHLRGRGPGRTRRGELHLPNGDAHLRASTERFAAVPCGST